jgi:hypothetical protein
MNGPWFIINPIMGVFITRDFGISMFLTFMGQGYQPWILFNTNLPENYHLGLFIYSYSNIDFFPYQEFFSKWEKTFYFYEVSLTEKMRFWTRLETGVELPYGFDFFQIEKEFKRERFYFVPIIKEFIRWFVVNVLGFMPRLLAVLPLTIIWFFFTFLPLWIIFYPFIKYFFSDIEFFNHVKSIMKYNGLFSKKQE